MTMGLMTNTVSNRKQNMLRMPQRSAMKLQNSGETELREDCEPERKLKI